MFVKKSMIVALGAAAGVFGAYGDAATLPEDFESETVGAMSLTGWTGYGTVEATASQTLTAGAPIAGGHTKNLAVDGWVAADLSLTSPASSDRQLDMLVKVAKPDDALDGMSDAEAKFALAIDSDGVLKYYNGTAWTGLGYSAFTEGDWIRVAVIFDSAAKRCKVSVNGNAATTGYKAATGDATSGPWYAALNNPTTIASMKVVGTTALDDLVVTSTANASYEPTYKDSEGADIVVATGSTSVPLAWYDKNNIPTSAANTTTGDGSGMTTEQKYITGVANDGSKFELKAMVLVKESETVKATITLPTFAVATGYTAKLQTSSDNTNWTNSDVTPTSGGNAEITLSGNVTYIRLVAVPSAS